MTGFQFCLKLCLETPSSISGSATPYKNQVKQGKQSLVGSSTVSPCFHPSCCSRLGHCLTVSPPPPGLTKMVRAHQAPSFPSSSWAPGFIQCPNTWAFIYEQASSNPCCLQVEVHTHEAIFQHLSQRHNISSSANWTALAVSDCDKIRLVLYTDSLSL